MAEKKYFWLKLKEDFFRQKEIKKLRKIAGGDTYTIIYLKMQLLSLKNEGLLYYEGLEETFEEQLSLEIDEDTDNVKITLAFLFSNNLIEEIKDNEYLLPKASECIGKEGSSAQRVRKCREEKKQKQIEGQTALQSNTKVTKCNTEKEKEKEIEIDKDIEKEESLSVVVPSNHKVFKHFEKCGILNTVTSNPTEYTRLMEFIAADIEVYGAKWLMDAADEAVKRGKINYKYLSAILQNWKAEGRGTNGTSSKSNENTGTEGSPKYDFSCYE